MVAKFEIGEDRLIVVLLIFQLVMSSIGIVIRAKVLAIMFVCTSPESTRNHRHSHSHRHDKASVSGANAKPQVRPYIGVRHL